MRGANYNRRLYGAFAIAAAAALLASASAAPRKFVLECDSLLFESSLDSAVSQRGILEKTGKNDGSVQKYLDALGLPPGAPYCAAGQYWSFAVAARAIGLDKSEIPLPRSGLANAVFEKAAKKGKKSELSARRGDLLVWRKGKTRRGHIERIIRVGKAAAWVIAFNVSKRIGGERREGVFVKKRFLFAPLGRLYFRGLVGFELKGGRK